ncbi:MAG: hypothetical protein AAF802_01690 [Planctomycetota bacterium]
MNSTLKAAPVVIAVLVIAVFFADANANNQAKTNGSSEAQSIGRFQITSFATRNDAYGGGYYVIDTTTGEVWRGTGDKSLVQVSEALLDAND